MGALLTGAGCCLACCCADCADGCRKWLGAERVTKIYYFILVLVFVIPAIFVFFFLNQWISFIQYFQEWFKCPATSGGSYECIGSSAVFRLSICLLILFALMMLIMVCRSRLAMVINQGCFFIKYLLVVGLFIGSLWISNTAFEGYATASQYISIAFMILQCIILIDLFYLAGIRLVRRYDSGQNMYACYLITLTILGFAAAVGLNVLGYIYFAIPTDGCDSSLWVNIVTTIMLIAMPGIQFLHFNEQNSLLTTALVSTYVAFLNFIAQFSFQAGLSTNCDRITIGSLIADIIISTFFFILTMYGSIMGGTGNVKVTRDGNINAAIGVANTQLNEPQKGQAYQAPVQRNAEQMQVKNEQKYTQTWDWVKWHFYMCLAAVYIGMLITNWNSANITTGQLQQSGFGFWVRIVISWATFLLYIWTMIAPRVCPARDFRVE